MIVENASCKDCFLSKVCSTGLRPERIKPGGEIIKAPLPKAREACRHSSCDEGLYYARKVKNAGEGKPTDVIGADSKPKNIVAGAFGSYHKPTEPQKLRIVDIETGEIYSNQDGIYFFTGQIAIQ